MHLVDTSGERKLTLEEEIYRLELEKERLTREIQEKQAILKDDNLVGAITEIVNLSLDKIVPFIKARSDKLPRIPKVKFEDSASRYWSNDSEKSTSKEASPYRESSSFGKKRRESCRDPPRNMRSIFCLSKISSARQEAEKPQTISNIWTHRPTFSRDHDKSKQEEDYSSDDANESDYEFQFVKEISSSPQQVLTTTAKVYKIIVLKNVGDLPWPNDCFLEPSHKSKGYIAKVPSPEPGQEVRATICLINSGKPGKQKFTWRLAYKTPTGEKKYIGKPFEINIDVKMLKSFSATDDLPVIANDSIQKAKKLKDAFPHAKFEDLLSFISKQDDSLGTDDLIQAYLDTIEP